MIIIKRQKSSLKIGVNGKKIFHNISSVSSSSGVHKHSNNYKRIATTISKYTKYETRHNMYLYKIGAGIL